MKSTALKITFLLALASAVGLTSTSQVFPADDVQKAIFSQIDAAGTFKGYELDVQSRGGTVWLRGHVVSVSDKVAIEQIARKTKGVDEVRNDLLVTAAPGKESSELAQAVQERIRLINSGGAREITISSSGSIVTLSGVASSQSMKEKLEEAARQTPGVASVVNEITIVVPNDSTIQSEVRQQIAQAPDLKISNLEVSVQDGVVTISGKGVTHRDTDEALALALNVDGVKDAKSHIMLDNTYRWDPRQDQ